MENLETEEEKLFSLNLNINENLEYVGGLRVGGFDFGGIISEKFKIENKKKGKN